MPSDGEHKKVERTTAGGPLVTGSAEVVLQNGRAVFNNLRIMEVSSKHMAKTFHIVIEPRIPGNIQPATSAAVRVLAKKIPGIRSVHLCNC